MDHITFLVAVAVAVAVVVVTALAFDFTNGFHDTANAKTISGRIVDDTLVSLGMIFAGLVGAILWNLATWLVGLPSSSSHALFGGLIGVVEKILIPAVASPLVAGVAALIATYLAHRLTARAREKSVTKGFRIGQIAASSLVSLAHGTNDAQKTMGVITLTLISAGALGHDAGPPVWVIASAGLAIGLGTYLGGRRIIRTMGKGLTEIRSPQGFAAETASTTVILTSAHLGFALSTTQVASGSILGAGLGRRLAEVRRGVAGRRVIAWLITLPAAALVGDIVLISRRNPVHAHNVNDTHEVILSTAQPTEVGTAA
ncbi:inorganic phosphate transporter [Streptomyces sp. NPDC005820]|uniref:inorganic phosphate transporter n=1 Tax=Streptomyces sp. NPDC005820 TaxID=3157069 RepID=UPI0033F93B01